MAGYSEYPSWSPGGDKLLFTRALSPTKSFYLIDAITTEQRRLGEGKFAVWSPNGQQIVFVTRKNGSDAIYSEY
jgi:Tol biopolymer transport system component